MVDQDPDQFTKFPTPLLYSAFFLPSTISVITKEAKIILAIEAIRTSKKLSRRKTAKLYNIPFSTLNDRMNGHLPLLERRLANIKLSKLEEEVIVRNILELDCTQGKNCLSNWYTDAAFHLTGLSN